MRKSLPNRGYTLLELMITVAVLGVLAALAIPALSAYVARSKTSEVSSNLNQLFKGAASYYVSERGSKGIGSSVTGHCTVGNAGPSPSTPSRVKQKFIPDGEMRALNFVVGDYVYFSYGVTSAGALCGRTGNSVLYTFYANGDLDGDADMSIFTLAAGSDAQNLLYHARGLYVADEIE